MWKLDLQIHSCLSTSDNIIKTTPGVTQYAMARITDIKSALETVFDLTIENKIIKITNIEKENANGKKRGEISKEKFFKHTLDNNY